MAAPRSPFVGGYAAAPDVHIRLFGIESEGLVIIGHGGLQLAPFVPEIATAAECVCVLGIDPDRVITICECFVELHQRFPGTRGTVCGSVGRLEPNHLGQVFDCLVRLSPLVPGATTVEKGPDESWLKADRRSCNRRLPGRSLSCPP